LARVWGLQFLSIYVGTSPLGEIEGQFLVWIGVGVSSRKEYGLQLRAKRSRFPITFNSPSRVEIPVSSLSSWGIGVFAICLRVNALREARNSTFFLDTIDRAQLHYENRWPERPIYRLAI